MAFVLDERLAADTLPVTALELCEVRLMDDARYPWLVLVPRKAGMVEILDLDLADQQRLFSEARTCLRALQKVYRPDKLNIAALGNVVSQLHVHLIARYRTDDAWPRPVWGVHPPVPYPAEEAEARCAAIKEALRT